MLIFNIFKTLTTSRASKGFNKVKVLGKYLFAHLRFIFVDHFKFKWINNVSLWAVKHRTSSCECYYFGMYDYTEMKFLSKYIRESDILLDVGSNIGSYALFAASYGANAIAVEPVPSSFNLIQKNIKLNPELQKRITAHNLAAGETECKVKFTIDMDTTNHMVNSEDDESSHKTVEIDCKPLDAFVPYATIMKIDVEGVENEVLKGADRILNDERLNVIIIEAFSEEALIKRIKSYGFKQYYYDIKKQSLEDGNGRREGENNILFIRDCETAKTRVID